MVYAAIDSVHGQVHLRAALPLHRLPAGEDLQQVRLESWRVPEQWLVIYILRSTDFRSMCSGYNRLRLRSSILLTPNQQPMGYWIAQAVTGELLYSCRL